MHWLTRIPLLLQRELARFLPRFDRRPAPVPVLIAAHARRARRR